MKQIQCGKAYRQQDGSLKLTWNANDLQTLTNAGLDTRVKLIKNNQLSLSKVIEYLLVVEVDA